MPKSAILEANEDATLYFMEIRATKKLIKSLNKTMSKLKSKGKIFADMFETKSIVKTYTGALYQTHTLLDLLDMKLA